MSSITINIDDEQKRLLQDAAKLRNQYTAAGKISKESFANWLKSRTVKINR